jgi:hypothetical protein
MQMGERDGGAAMGQHIVYRHAYGFGMAGPVTRCTDASAYVAKQYGRSKERRLSFDDIVFSGDEKSVSRLLEKLQSSQALCNQEKLTASVRLDERNAKLIAAARTQGSE